MPKRERSGDEISPARVVAPTKVNGFTSMRMRARRRPLSDDDVELVVFQRRIEQLFQRRLQAMNLVDEQHLLVRMLVRIAVRSPLICSVGPEVGWKCDA